MLQYTVRLCDTPTYRWRLLGRKNVTLDHTPGQSTSSPQGAPAEWTGVPLLHQGIWHSPQAVGFSGPDHPMGIPSPSAPTFQFASSSLSSALSPSISSSNPTPVHLQLDGTPQYLPGGCGSPAIDSGNTPMDIDYDNISQDHRPIDPNRGSLSTVVDIPLRSIGTCPPVRFSVPRNPSNERPPENASITNNTHSNSNHPNLEAEVPSVTSTFSASVLPTPSVHNVAVAHHAPCPSIPEILVLEEAAAPVPSPGSEPTTSTKSKRGRQGSSYKLSSSLPVTIE